MVVLSCAPVGWMRKHVKLVLKSQREIDRKLTPPGKIIPSTPAKSEGTRILSKHAY